MFFIGIELVQPALQGFIGTRRLDLDQAEKGHGEGKANGLEAETVRLDHEAGYKRQGSPGEGKPSILMKFPAEPL